MRTTLTLDDDIVEKLKNEAAKCSLSFRDVVNRFLRLGLNTKEHLATPGKFAVNPKDLGEIPGVNYNKISDLLEQIEGRGHG